MWRTIFHGKHPTLEQRKSVKSRLPEDKGAAEKIWDELTAAPVFYPPAPLRRRKQRKWGVKSRKKGGVRGRCFKVLVLFLKFLI